MRNRNFQDNNYIQHRAHYFLSKFVVIYTNFWRIFIHTEWGQSKINSIFLFILIPSRSMWAHTSWLLLQSNICKQLLSHQYPTDLDNVIFHFQPKVEAVIHIHCSLKLNLLRRNTSIVFCKYNLWYVCETSFCTKIIVSLLWGTLNIICRCFVHRSRHVKSHLIKIINL